MKNKNYPKLFKILLFLALALGQFGIANAQCDAPANVTVSDASATSALVSWDASTSAPGLGYQYEVRTSGEPGSSVDPNSGYVLSGNTGDGILSTTVENLSISTEYFFYVRYQCSASLYSPWTTEATIQTTTLEAPVATAAIYISDDSFLARWNPSEGASGYRLDVSTDSGFTTFVPGFEDRAVSITSSVVSELTPSTTYYYRVRAEGTGGEGFVTTANSNTITVTTLAVPLDYVVWTEAGWSGDPLLELDAIIDWDYNTATDQVFEAKSLTINSGFTLTIASGTYIIIDNEIVNNAGPTGFVIENNANLLQLNDSAPANSGEATVYRDSAPIFRLDYTMWSSPVVGTQTLQEFSPQTLSNRFYTYTPATDLFTPHDPSNVFEQAKGYLIRTPNNHTPYVDENSVGEIWTGMFQGVPGNGEIAAPVSDAGQGFNMIGNPYPSVVSIENFFLLNDTNIDGIVYFWRRRNSTTPGATGSYYATYTNLGGTASDSSEVPNGFIQTGQGFIVKANPGTTEVLFNNSVRVNDNFENQFFRTNEIERHRLWLNLTNDAGVFSQALIGYSEGATNGVDHAIDGKYINDSEVAFTSLLDNTEYVIQGRTLPFDANDVVPMQFKTTTAGTYTISLPTVDGLFAGDQQVYIQDVTTNVIHNLKESPYSFSTEAGVFADRFNVVYNSQLLGVNNPGANASSVVAYNRANTLYIDGAGQQIDHVVIYDLTGRMIYSKTGINASQAALSDINVSNQMVLVQITTEAGTVTKKMLF